MGVPLKRSKRPLEEQLQKSCERGNTAVKWWFEATEEVDRLQAEVERLRAALVEERADNLFGHWGGPQTREHALAEAREKLRSEGLLPPE